MEKIYKICPRSLWREAEIAGVFRGAAIDLSDGFIHFSGATQVAETLRLHFGGQDELVLVEIDPESLEIIWEESRGGQLFPHLYGVLPTDLATRVLPLPLRFDGGHELPDFIPSA